MSIPITIDCQGLGQPLRLTNTVTNTSETVCVVPSTETGDMFDTNISNDQLKKILNLSVKPDDLDGNSMVFVPAVPDAEGSIKWAPSGADYNCGLGTSKKVSNGAVYEYDTLEYSKDSSIYKCSDPNAQDNSDAYQSCCKSGVKTVNGVFLHSAGR